MKVAPLLFAGFLAMAAAGLSLEETSQVNLHLLETQLHMQFINEDGENVFVAALNKLPDGLATNEDIEGVVGGDYALFKKLWASAKIRALGLVTRLMENTQRVYTAGNPRLLRIFTDYLLMLKLNLSPETVFLNRDSYIIFSAIDEGLFTQIYSELTKIYSLWRPLKLVLEQRRDHDFKDIKKLVAQKNPNYQPLQLEIAPNTLTTGLEPTVEVIENPETRIPPPVFDFGDAKAEPETPMDDPNNLELHTPDDLKLFSFLQQNVKIEAERQLESAKVFGALLVGLIGVLVQ